MKAPNDADERRQAKPIVCYNVESVPRREEGFITRWRESLKVIETVIVPPRDARTFRVPKGYGFRIVSIEGSQVGDLNLWNAENLNERFFSGKTRQLHASHLTRGDRLWTNLPYMRPMATISYDSLEWYGWDEDGGSVHDVIGTRCDPYTNHTLNGEHYHFCCHSNLSRALSKELNQPIEDIEVHIHDVMNVFMCTGFTRDTHQYFMKASPVRPGDFIEFLADIDLLGALSACPGGNCGSSHSDDKTPCFPLQVDILKPDDAILETFNLSSISGYNRTHGQ